MLLYGDAKKLLAQYAGRGGSCVNASGVDQFCREVFEYLLFSGSYQDLRKFTFIAQKGCFTVPYEIESIQKVKIDGEVGQVWNKWFEFHSAKHLSEDCLPADEALFEEPNYYATAYDLPCGGAHVEVMGTCEEDSDAHVIIQGKDTTGREIFTIHKGQQISGEYLSIKKFERHYTQVKFGEITHVTKTRTNGYVNLAWTVPGSAIQHGFLSDYSPLEENPSYRRYRLTSRNCCPFQKVSVLARIRLKEKYSDNDKIPFDTLFTLRLAAQRINADYNGDIQTADAKDKFMSQIIEREAAYKKVQNGSPVEFFYPLSAGTIKNTINRKMWR